jgi:hypothetical protein
MLMQVQCRVETLLGDFLKRRLELLLFLLIKATNAFLKIVHAHFFNSWISSDLDNIDFTSG